MVSVLLSTESSDHVFRATLLAIVLTSGVGFNATLLCDVWCHPSLGAGECHDRDTSDASRIAGDESCGHALAVVAIHEQLLKDAPAPDLERPVSSLVDVIADPLLYPDRRACPWTEPPLALRPPTSILRI